ncbi:glycosyltransferase [Sphingomonas lenta]|uniref:glycosyltransferase n=1 Tax=Sphingomonas lenta TaxID=1141887 RepID=UPI001595C474
MTRTVSAVILTYNRRSLLTECLAAVHRQSRPVDHVLIIDNGGTDGTAEWLVENWSERVEVYRLPCNRGSAGGFHAAMRIGYERGDDAIWLMDDDVIPATDALERLLNARETLKAHGVDAPFVLSTARTPEGLLTNVPEVDQTLNSISYLQWPMMLSEGMVPVRRATFVSILLNREVLREHGLPLADLYMWVEDTEFTDRVTRTAPGFMVGKSKVVHARSIPGALDIRTERDPVRLRNHYFLRRNWMYLTRRRSKWQITGRRLFQEVRYATKLLVTGDRHRAWTVLSGAWAGLFFKPALIGVESPCDLDNLRVVGPAASCVATQAPAATA